MQPVTKPTEATNMAKGGAAKPRTQAPAIATAQPTIGCQPPPFNSADF